MGLFWFCGALLRLWVFWGILAFGFRVTGLGLGVSVLRFGFDLRFVCVLGCFAFGLSGFMMVSVVWVCGFHVDCVVLV